MTNAADVGALRTRLSPAQEDYLKQILLATEGGARATTRALAQRLGVQAGSVTGMVQRLVRLGLVVRHPYRGAALTPSGRRVAVQVLRHHRVLETFLQRELGMGWEEVHAEAERLEHVVSHTLVERLAERLGHPERDPHGAPIPAADLSLPPAGGGRPLEQVPEGSVVRIVRVAADGPGALRRLAAGGLVPGAQVRVEGRGPRTVTVSSGARAVRIAHDLAGAVLVEEVEEERCDERE